MQRCWWVSERTVNKVHTWMPSFEVAEDAFRPTPDYLIRCVPYAYASTCPVLKSNMSRSYDRGSCTVSSRPEIASHPSCSTYRILTRWPLISSMLFPFVQPRSRVSCILGRICPRSGEKGNLRCTYHAFYTPLLVSHCLGGCARERRCGPGSRKEVCSSTTGPTNGQKGRHA